MKYLFLFLGGLTLFISGCTNQTASKDSFNIVLITIDTLRADHLSCYGYEKKTTPNIDKIAENGILFKNVIAPSSWTAPSMVSLFTSVYPINHGVINGIAPLWNPKKQEVFSDKLSTLTELLKDHGYTTFGVSSNFHLSKKFGFARGFDHFKYLPSGQAPNINQSVYSWENEINSSDRFFLWVHYFEPHIPYKLQATWIDKGGTKGLNQKRDFAGKPFPVLKKLLPLLITDPEALANLVDLYDSEVNYVDVHVGELIRKFGLNQNTLVIITSDHGEELLDHNQIGHGHQLHQETIQIPLIIKLPNSLKRKTVEKQVNLIDVMPTILHILDINFPEQIIGESLLETNHLLFRLKKILSGKNNRNFNYSELDGNFSFKTVITPEWKYIYDFKNKTEQLYNIKLDPSESINLVDKETAQNNLLKEQLFAWIKNSKKYPPKKESFILTEDDEKKLEALGYLNPQKAENENHQDISNENGNYWLEAENAEIVIKPLVVSMDMDASEGKYIFAPIGSGHQYTPSPIMAIYKIDILQEGTYTLWGRVSAPGGKNNSFFIQVDNDPDNLWEIENGKTWHWDQVNNRGKADPVKFSFEKGLHTIKVKLREDGTKLDKILLTSNLDFAPQGK